MTKPGRTQGDVVRVKIAGKTYDLIPNIQAMTAFNMAFDGLGPALRGVQNLNFATAANIVNCGVGGKLKQKEVDKIASALWSGEGRSEALGAISDYLLIMINGGVRPDADREDDTTAEEDGAGNA